MKKFEMPVVVLNEMTMNESIASDCCYKLVTEGYVTTKTVLNGGSIGSYVTYPLKANVVEAYGSRSVLPNYHYKLYVPGTTVGTIYTSGVTSGATSAGWVLSFDTVNGSLDPTQNQLKKVVLVDGTVLKAGSEEDNLTGAYLVQVGGACDHYNSDCPFVTKTTASNQHIGATMKHLFGGTAWDAPHTAQQYNS